MLSEKAARILEVEWKRTCALAAAHKLTDFLENQKLIRLIKDCINSSTKTYRYVLPTQIVSKLADVSLDSRSLQAAGGEPGSFDARSVAHKIIVPFDQRNENVLGGSQEPYVSNPLRVPKVSNEYREAQRDKAGWDTLCHVLDEVERKKNKDFTLRVFRQVLTEIYKRLSTVRVVYGVPRRMSIKKALDVIHTFLSEQSGGDRLLAMSSALFTTIGRKFGLFEKVRRAKITAADQASGMLADLECLAKDGRITLAVEVKDRQITISQLRAKLRTIREKRVSEIFFVAQGILPAESDEVEALIDREFASGQNVYVTDLGKLCSTVLSILGEDGRRAFLAEVGNQLDTFKSEITHRQAWASILQSN